MKGGLANMFNLVPLHGAADAVFYFTVYAFFGWLLENGYSFLTKEGFFKANFLKGPFKPMYGFAPVFLLALITEHTHWAAVLFMCFFIPTLIEYISGLMLKKLFKRTYWDYSKIPFQLHGHICLPFSICWIVLSFACLHWIHPGVSSLYGTVEPYWSWIYPAAIFYFAAELIFSIRRHSFTGISAEKPTNTI
jgi:uncharacterized membrane protein